MKVDKQTESKNAVTNAAATTTAITPITNSNGRQPSALEKNKSLKSSVTDEIMEHETNVNKMNGTNNDLNVEQNGRHVNGGVNNTNILHPNGDIFNKNIHANFTNNVVNNNHGTNNFLTNDNSMNLSHLITEKIDFETRNIEHFIDKTVTGIVELKDDLMKKNENQTYLLDDGMRLRRNNIHHSETDNGGTTFIQKEIDALKNAAAHQANVLPAVLSNGHGK